MNNCVGILETSCVPVGVMVGLVWLVVLVGGNSQGWLKYVNLRTGRWTDRHADGSDVNDT